MQFTELLEALQKTREFMETRVPEDGEKRNDTVPYVVTAISTIGVN
jgi:hypothetical protein